MKLGLAKALVRLLGKRDLGRTIAFATTIATVLACASLAWAARPGGGSSFSGGSRSSGGGGGSRSSGGGSYSGGGGGGGDGEAIGALLVLCFEHPAIGIPLVIIIIVIAVVMKMRSNGESSGSEWSSGGGGAFGSFTSGGGGYSYNNYAAPEPPRPSGEPLRGKLETLRNTDPAFSIVVFEDFLYFLYAEMHRARGAGSAQALAAYVSDTALGVLGNDGRVAGVDGIIIGSMTYESVDIDAQGGARIAVIVESNYVERWRPQGEQRYYVKERLTLTRAPGAKSRDPGKSRTLNCPNCGGPLSNMRGTTCTYCKTTVPQGTKDWAIAGIQVLEKEPRGPLLTSSVEEQGNDMMTVVSPNAQGVFNQIVAKDPQGTSWNQLQQRIGVVFQEFHAGWVARDPAKVRPYVSDNLFQSQMYWIDLYRNNHCINRTDGSHITRIELAAASTDAYYDAVTVRVWATGQDYTISEDGRVMSGIQGRMRPYSEYWTMIRGAQKKKTDKPANACPNCGAPLKISMTGNCEYCKVKVTSGEYDWVLSRIEQDEVYTG